MARSFLQTDSWGELKSRAGWLPLRVSDRLGLFKPIVGKLGFWYFPELEWNELELEKLVKSQAVTSYRPIFTRLEFLVAYDNKKASQLESLGLVKSFEEVQPEYRRLIDLDQTDESLLLQMKPGGRYKVKLALRQPLEIEVGVSQRMVERFFQLYLKTARRAGFAHRGREYFLELVAILDKERVGEVILVTHQGRDLAGGIFLYYDEVGSYLYGGSDQETGIMASHRLHIEAIRRARDRGCKIYDLIAVAPPDAKDHPFAGLTRFKEQFGGKTVRLLGGWDYIYRPYWYKIYSLLETLRRKR